MQKEAEEKGTAAQLLDKEDMHNFLLSQNKESELTYSCQKEDYWYSL